MIEDNDLHDGVVPSIFVARTKYDSAESTQKLVEITPNKDGYYTFESFSAEDNFIVDHVAPVVINIDEQIEEGTEIVLEADGHTYVIGKIANYGKITIVNGKTDYTKVVDGAYVDAFGHIQEPLKNTFKSYWANVRFAAAAGSGENFANYGTFETVFATGVDGATRNYELNLGHTAGLYNYGLIELNGTVTWNFTPKLAWQASNNRWRNHATCAVYNYGTIKIGNDGPFNYTGTVKLIATFEDFQNYMIYDGDVDRFPDGFIAPFENNGTLEIFASSLTVNNLTNRGEIKLGSTLTVQGLFYNAKDATITGADAVYKNPLTGVDNVVAPSLRLTARTIAKFVDERSSTNDGVKDFRNIVTANHINAGTIAIDSTKEETIFRTYGIFNNNSVMTLKGNKAEVNVRGQLNNKGTFTTGGMDFIILVEKDGWTYIEQTVSGKTNFEVYPLGIQNDGTMNISGYRVLNNGGKFVNNGEMTLNVDTFVNYEDDWQAETFPDEGPNGCNPALSSFTTVKADVLVYDDCDNCPGHKTESEFITFDGRIFNNGNLTIKRGRTGFEMFYNGKDATLTIGDNATFFTGVVNINTDYGISRCLAYYTHDAWFFENLGKVSASGVFANIGRFENAGEFVMEKGTFYNFSELINAKDASFVNNATFKNYDEKNLEKVTVVGEALAITNERYDAKFTAADMFEGYVLNKGELVNNGTLYNEYGYDIRNEGTLDNVNGKITNKGMIVNVGTFTSTVEGIDNQFAIHGYDVTYVNKADAETPADTTAKADVETPADTTKAPVKTPAAQTSDVAVAGFAVIATLALAGVVVAKKVR